MSWSLQLYTINKNDRQTLQIPMVHNRTRCKEVRRAESLAKAPEDRARSPPIPWTAPHIIVKPCQRRLLASASRGLIRAMQKLHAFAAYFRRRPATGKVIVAPEEVLELPHSLPALAREGNASVLAAPHS